MINCECQRFNTNANYEPFVHDFWNVQIQFSHLSNCVPFYWHRIFFVCSAFSFDSFHSILVAYILAAYLFSLFLVFQHFHIGSESMVRLFIRLNGMLLIWCPRTLISLVKNPFRIEYISSFSTQSICFGLRIQYRKKF